MNTPSPSGFIRSGPGFLGAVLGLFVAVFALVLMVGALLLGLVVAAAALLWSIVRGRRPGPMRFEWRKGMARARRSTAGRPPSDDVVDIDVRVVTDDSPSRPQH